VTQRQAERAICDSPVVQAAMIFKPCGMRGVLMQVLRRNGVMLAVHHPAQPREKRFSLVRAAFANVRGLLLGESANAG